MFDAGRLRGRSRIVIPACPTRAGTRRGRGAACIDMGCRRPDDEVVPALVLSRPSKGTARRGLHPSLCPIPGICQRLPGRITTLQTAVCGTLAKQSAKGDQSNGTARRNRLRSSTMGGLLGDRGLYELRFPPSPRRVGTVCCRQALPRREMSIAVRPGLSIRIHDQREAKVLSRTDQQVCGFTGSAVGWRGASCGRQWLSAGLALCAGSCANPAGRAHKPACHGPGRRFASGDGSRVHEARPEGPTPLAVPHTRRPGRL